MHNVVASPGNGTVQALFNGGSTSTVNYFDIEQVFTNPAAS
jgi:hypothetical protein